MGVATSRPAAMMVLQFFVLVVLDLVVLLNVSIQFVVVNHLLLLLNS